MWLTLAALVLGGAPKTNDAEALFRQMEDKIRKAETLQADLSIQALDKISLKGSLAVAPKNRFRLELTGTANKEDGKLVMVSDGTMMRSSHDGRQSKDQPAQPQMTEIALGSMARAGIFVPLFSIEDVEEEGKKPEAFDLDKRLAVADFKLGKKEAVGGTEAQAVEHTLKMRSLKEPIAVTVWIDPKTQLPVKRVVRSEMDGQKYEVTETYTDVKVNQKIDEKRFELPK